MAKESEEIPWEALLEDDNEENGEKLSKSFESMLSDIFNRFDEDKDGALSKLEIQSFFKFMGSKFEDEQWDDLIENFDILRNDKGAVVGPTKHGFYQLYHLQTCADPEETLRDIKKMGFKVCTLTKTIIKE